MSLAGRVACAGTRVVSRVLLLIEAIGGPALGNAPAALTAKPPDARIELVAARVAGGLAAALANLGVELRSVAVPHGTAALAADAYEEVAPILLRHGPAAAFRRIGSRLGATSWLRWRRRFILRCWCLFPLIHSVSPGSRVHDTHDTKALVAQNSERATLILPTQRPDCKAAVGTSAHRAISALAPVTKAPVTNVSASVACQ